MVLIDVDNLTVPQVLRREKRQLISQRTALELQLEAASQSQASSDDAALLKQLHKEHLLLEQRLSKLTARPDSLSLPF